MKNEAKFITIGKVFGKLTVIQYMGLGYYKNSKIKTSLIKCKCECGNEISVPYSSLKNGSTKSCGCLSHELTVLRNTKHNGTKECPRLYKIWKGIRKRCFNHNAQNYKYYGGKGVSICEEWNTFENFRDWSFKNGYNDTLTIDRIDNNGNYEPNNCQWITNEENISKCSSKPVYQIDIVTNKIINKFESMTLAYRFLNKKSTSITKCINKTIKTAYGYKWVLVEDYIDNLSDNQYAEKL